MGRVVVVGLDGLAWPVLDALLAEGRLPSFGQALRSGAAWSLRSTTPPLTPAAWSTLFSGLPPAQHMVFDFTARDAGSYHLRGCSSADRQARMVWSLASDEGRTVVVVNVPMTYPPLAVNGIMVSGMDAPRLRGAVTPSGALGRVLATAPDYAVDAMSHWFADRAVFADRLRRMHRARHRVALDLLDSVAPDLFICVYVLADRVQHVEWRDNSPSPAVREAYEALDRALGDYLDRLGTDDTLMIVSDHGFQSLRSEMCLNKILLDGGLLRLRRGRCRQIVARHNRRQALNRTSFGPVRSCWHLPPRAVWFDDVDWARTRCAAFGLMGNLMVNQTGRDPEGIVRPGAETASVLREVEQLVNDTVARSSGRAPVTVHPVVWDHHRPATVSPPDAVVEVDGYRVSTWGGREFYCPTTLQDNREGHTGVHSPNGVFLGLGKGIACRPLRGSADAIDIAPTIMELLGVDPGARLPGSSLGER